jgi:tetratricopeptide (TPR) repeat protein
LEKYIAEAKHFRPETVSRWSDEKIVDSASKLPWIDSGTTQDAIVQLHLQARKELLSTYLDLLDVEHVDGAVVHGELEKPFQRAQLEKAADDLLRHFPAVEVVFYLLALRILYPTAFAALDLWLRSKPWTEQGIIPDPADISTFAKDTSADSGETILPLEVPGFTTLDRRLIVTIVDSAAHVTGSLNQDEIEDLLIELQQLNSARHKTYFHVGYRDAVFDLPAATHLPAANQSRRRWYWAGYLSGLARKSNTELVVQLFDSEPTVRELGQLGDGASHAASWIVFQALNETGRLSEAARFITNAALRVSSDLRQLVRGSATSLIRRQQPSEAREMLQMLETVAYELADDLTTSEYVDDEFIADVKRRLALCQRQLGHTDEALSLLEELLIAPNDRLRAIVLSDIGLIKTKHRRLGELALPQNKDELASFVAALALGESEFDQALEDHAFQPAHASFARGVLRFARGDYAGAGVDLARALSHFSAEPEVYDIDGTLALAELYNGLVICLSLGESGATHRACELVRSGLRRGARVPSWLIRSTVDALSLVRSDLAQEIISSLLEFGDKNVLDELLDVENAGDSKVLRAELLKRARDDRRPGTERAADYRRLLPWAIQSSEIPEAVECLEYLQEQAIRGIGREDFLKIIADDAKFAPAWDTITAGEARVIAFEASGQYDEAALQIQMLVHQLLALDHATAIDEALLLAERLDGYGPRAADVLSDVRGTVEARLLKREREESVVDSRTESDINADVHILIVGGNEQQAKMEADIQRKVRESLPHVSLEFIQTGWSGNWSSYADQFSRRVERADGVVVLTLIRTMLGRTIRANCDVPWRACRGGGQGEVITTIKRVVPMARRYLLANGPKASTTAPNQNAR